MQSRTAFVLVACILCINALEGDGAASTLANKSSSENTTWHNRFKLWFLPGGASADLDGIEMQQPVPAGVRSEMYHPICDMHSPLFQLHNRHALGADREFKSNMASGFLSASWIAWLNVLYCLLSLMVTWMSLPENPMGDLRTWHVFDQERRTEREHLFNDMTKQEIDEISFKAAVREYWVRDKENTESDAIETALFKWLTCDTQLLTYDQFRGVYIVSGMPWSHGSWHNCEGVQLPLEGKYSTGVLRALFSAFRHSTDNAEIAWLAFTLAANLWPKDNIDIDLMGDRSSNIANEEDEEDRPILHRYILNRVNPREPLHCQMTVRELLPGAEYFPRDRKLSDFPSKQNGLSVQKKARSYVTSMLDRPMRVGGTNLFLPYNTKTGLAIFLFLTATGTATNCWHLNQVSGMTWTHPGSLWVKMTLTFKSEVYLMYFYHNVNLLLNTIRLMAMVGMDPIARRHGHGLGLLNSKYLQAHQSRLVVLIPALLSFACQLGNFIFIPVTLVWVGIGVVLVCLLEPRIHKCRRPFNTPMFTTAPLLALITMDCPLGYLSDWLLPDTFLCTWAKLDLVSPTLLEHVNDLSGAEKLVTSLTNSSIAGLVGALALCALLSILAWLAFKLPHTERVVTEWFFTAWVRQSSDLLSLLHKDQITNTADAIGEAWRLANEALEDKHTEPAREFSTRMSGEDSDTDQSSDLDTSSPSGYACVHLA